MIDLYQLPIGAVTRIIDHHEKTIRWVRTTADGEVECDPPPGWRVPPGFTHRAEKCDEA